MSLLSLANCLLFWKFLTGIFRILKQDIGSLDPLFPLLISAYLLLLQVASLKHQENFSFGWLKLQLETRVSKDQAEQTTWRPRRGLQISPFQTGNAQKALNMWKTMEQRCIANT